MSNRKNISFNKTQAETIAFLLKKELVVAAHGFDAVADMGAMEKMVQKIEPEFDLEKYLKSYGYRK